MESVAKYCIGLYGPSPLRYEPMEVLLVALKPSLEQREQSCKLHYITALGLSTTYSIALLLRYAVQLAPFFLASKLGLKPSFKNKKLKVY